MKKLASCCIELSELDGGKFFCNISISYTISFVFTIADLDFNLCLFLDDKVAKILQQLLCDYNFAKIDKKRDIATKNAKFNQVAEIDSGSEKTCSKLEEMTKLSKVLREDF